MSQSRTNTTSGNATQARLLISGTGSDCGKTTVTSALLRAWQRRGIPLAAFKCGPDYIDPLFHQAALGVPSRNLDLFFVEEARIRAELAMHIPTGGLGVIEGAMGFYDGVSGNTDTASAAHLARVGEIPAILVVRPEGQSLSLAAMIHGFHSFTANTLAGVILNGVTKSMYPFYRAIAAQAGLPVYGYLPPVPDATIPRRHLGLVTAAEIADLQHKLDRLADAAETSIELDRLLALARTAPALPQSPSIPARISITGATPSVRVAVARDKAFCFYYADHFDILREAGAELVFFSPLADRELPSSIGGLYLGGGYPELYTAELAANVSMRESIRQAVQNGLPTIAECGGFQYLHQSLDGYPMVGALPLTATMTPKLQPFGYVTLTAQADNLLCRAGETLRAHEFHYGVSNDNGTAFRVEKPNGRAWPGVHATATLYAGYPHLYFRSNPSCVTRFLQACLSRSDSSNPSDKKERSE